MAQSIMYNLPMFLPSDFMKPWELAEMYKRHGDQSLGLQHILRGMGRWEMISNEEWSGWEDTDIHETFVNQNFVAGGGQLATLTVDPTSVHAVGAQFFIYPKVGYEIRLPGNAMARIMTVNNLGAGVFTLDIAVRTGNVIPAIAAGQELAMITGSKAAGTGPVEPSGRDVRKKTFHLGFLKEMTAIEGGVLSDWVKSNVWADDGKSIVGVYSTALEDEQYRVDLQINGGLWWGQATVAGDPNFVEIGGAGFPNPILSTDGLFRHAIAQGMQMPTIGIPWGTPGALTFFDAITTYLIQQRVPTGYLSFMMGNDLANNLNRTFYQSNLLTNVEFTKLSESWFNGNGENSDGYKFAKAMAINFKQFGHASGFDFMFQTMFDWSNPTTYGVPIYDDANRAIIMPMTQIMNRKTKKYQDNIAFKFKGIGNYSRQHIVTTIDGTGSEVSVTNTFNDWKNTQIMSSFGLQVFASNQLINVFRT